MENTENRDLTSFIEHNVSFLTRYRNFLTFCVLECGSDALQDLKYIFVVQETKSCQTLCSPENRRGLIEKQYAKKKCLTAHV